MEKDAQIPKNACLKLRECRVVEGIVWVWMGDDTPQNGPPTQGDTLEQIDPITGKHKDYVVNDFQIDLPYDHSYLVENQTLRISQYPMMRHLEEARGKMHRRMK